MKIRKGNESGSLVVGIPPDVKRQMKLEVGTHITWSLNDRMRWEIVVIQEAEETEETKETKTE